MRGSTPCREFLRGLENDSLRNLIRGTLVAMTFLITCLILIVLLRVKNR